MWEPQIAAFASRHRVISYDVRGFGLSDAPRDPAAYSQTISVEDARALLETLGAASAAVCGLSMGGNIALNLALTHPEMVSRLILATPAPVRDAAAFKTRCEDYAQAADKGLEFFFDAVISTWAVFSDYGGQGDAQQKQLRDLVMAQHAHGMALTARHALATRKPVYALEPEMRRYACRRSSPTALATKPASSPASSRRARSPGPRSGASPTPPTASTSTNPTCSIKRFWILAS